VVSSSCAGAPPKAPGSSGSPCQLRHRARATAFSQHCTRLGLDYRIATRLTSWVAISDTIEVDPRAPSRRQRIAHELPHAMSAEGLGLRSAAAHFPISAAVAAPMKSKISMTMVGRLRVSAPAAAPRMAAPPPPPLESAGSVEDFAVGLTDSDDLELKTMVRSETQALEAIELPGTVTLDKDGRLVIAVEVTEPLDWILPESVTLVLADGTELPVRVDAKLSTAPTSASAGQTLRLVLALHAPLTAPLRQVELGTMAATQGLTQVVIAV
jgi:hypothetical protein